MTEENSMSNWFQDNLRIIISVGIVILLVFAIYSYSKRNSRTDIVVDDSQIAEIAMTADAENSDEINEIIDEIKDEKQDTAKTVSITTESSVDSENNRDEEERIALEQKIAAETKESAEQKMIEDKRIADEKIQQDTVAKENAENERIAKETAELEAKLALDKKLIDDKVAQEADIDSINNTEAKEVFKEVIESRSRQKEGVIIVAAVPNDSATTLARKATTDYITKNNVSGLTPAHKIYIEDYLQKAVSAKRIHPGTEMEFSNELIDSAVEASRTLNSSQLSNLDKYAANVSTL